jgi:hypothetical protein
MDRPARRQVAASKGPQRAPAAGAGEYNIWYGKRTGRDEKEQLQASTRCNPKLDCGTTLAGKGESFCVYFAQVHPHALLSGNCFLDGRFFSLTMTCKQNATDSLKLRCVRAGKM